MYFIVFADLNYTFIQFQHCTMVSSTNGSTEVKKPFQRLPTGVVPSHYEIFLKPNLSDLNFIGNINVELEVVQQTSELICNAVDLKIDGVKVNGKTFTFESQNYFKWKSSFGVVQKVLDTTTRLICKNTN